MFLRAGDRSGLNTKWQHVTEDIFDVEWTFLYIDSNNTEACLYAPIFNSARPRILLVYAYIAYMNVNWY